MNQIEKSLVKMHNKNSGKQQLVNSVKMHNNNSEVFLAASLVVCGASVKHTVAVVLILW
jgi:hypothetical protein